MHACTNVLISTLYLILHYILHILHMHAYNLTNTSSKEKFYFILTKLPSVTCIYLDNIYAVTFAPLTFSFNF